MPISPNTTKANVAGSGTVPTSLERIGPSFSPPVPSPPLLGPVPPFPFPPPRPRARAATTGASPAAPTGPGATAGATSPQVLPPIGPIPPTTIPPIPPPVTIPPLPTRVPDPLNPVLTKPVSAHRLSRQPCLFDCSLCNCTQASRGPRRTPAGACAVADSVSSILSECSSEGSHTAVTIPNIARKSMISFSSLSKRAHLICVASIVRQKTKCGKSRQISFGPWQARGRRELKKQSEPVCANYPTTEPSHRRVAVLNTN